jgi:hypothetical protein
MLAPSPRPLCCPSNHRVTHYVSEWEENQSAYLGGLALVELADEALPQAFRHSL